MVRAIFFISLLLCASATPAHAQSQALPTHFAFGLSAGQGDTWMPQSSISWDYRFQYLVGGVNTNSGWETWNPNGTFALNYAQESAQHGYIPMFPYYELLQSSGSCGNCDENKKDITNLNDANLMRAYYANFALLMKRLGPGTYDGVKGFGGTALINVEPDFSGGYTVQAVDNGNCFNFCTGKGNDPTLLKASVGGSGFSDVGAYADNYVGFTQALAHLRDLYAPNVMLGYDVSMWATGDDLNLDTNPNTNATALGQEVGSFISQFGPHEVLFNNPLDRDAGQYKVQFGQNRWWDRLNVTFPNFTRWEQYLGAIGSSDGSKPMLLWQVPAGNQYFQTENNTNGHFQDNRAEYIFSHIPELIQNGIVGVMFSPGNGGSTSWGDTMKDGITNPPPFCTTDGISTGQICNNHPSTVSDDDGGYIRMLAQAYYQEPVALANPSSTPPAISVPTVVVPAVASSAPAPLQVSLGNSTVDPQGANVGQNVTLQQDVSVNSDATLLVDFEIYDKGGKKVWQTWHDNETFQADAPTTDTAVFSVPDSLAPGTYQFKTGVFSAGWGVEYAWNDQAGVLTVTP